MVKIALKWKAKSTFFFFIPFPIPAIRQRHYKTMRKEIRIKGKKITLKDDKLVIVQFTQRQSHY